MTRTIPPAFLTEPAPATPACAGWLARCKPAISFMALAAWPLWAVASDGAAGLWRNAWAPQPSTSLIELRQGSDLSDIVRSTRGLGYETAVGEPVRFANWYGTRWTDTRVSWLTPIAPSSGIIWGLNTGERGKKYSISPGIKLGFIHQAQLGRGTVLTLRATTTLGSRLREKTCTADYGDIGGVRTVNCRLAATQLDPDETLNHLFRASSRDQRQMSIRFDHAF